MFVILIIGICNLFVIWDLEFVISRTSQSPFGSLFGSGSPGLWTDKEDKGQGGEGGMSEVGKRLSP